MNNKLILLIVAIIFVSSFIVGNWLNESGHQLQQFEKISMQYTACDPVQNACQAILQNMPISIMFLQQPTALQPFDIEVRSTKSDIQEIHMDFRMPSMNMGVNYYRLNKVSDGIWKGEVTLPVCTSRRSDWVGELQINYQGKLWVAEYPFTQSMQN